MVSGAKGGESRQGEKMNEYQPLEGKKEGRKTDENHPDDSENHRKIETEMIKNDYKMIIKDYEMITII